MCGRETTGLTLMLNRGLFAPDGTDSGIGRPADEGSRACAPERLGGHPYSEPETFAGARGYAILGLFAAALVIALLYFGFISISRRAIVNGVLYPEAGALGVVAPSDGILVKSFVSEGRGVKAGDPLFMLSLDTDLPSGPALATRLDQAEVARQTALQAQWRSDSMLLESQMASLRSQRQSLHDKRTTLVAQITAYGQRESLATAQIEKLQALADRGFVSMSQLQQLKDNRLQLRISMLGAQRELTETSHALAQLDAQSEEFTAKAMAAEAARTSTAAEILQARAQVDQRRTIVVRATKTGRVSSISLKAGMPVRAGVNLATILPTGSRLQAELLLPSRAVPFVTVGDRVQLRYEAFPYQQFGVGRATLLEVSRYPVPSDSAGKDGQQETLYRVRARLDREDVRADGRVWPLFAGMRLSATVPLERDSSLRRWVREVIAQP